MRSPQLIRELVQQLVLQDDSICLDQRRLLKSLLQGGRRSPEIVALHACVTYGVAKELSEQRGMPLNDMRKERFVRRLFEARGLRVALIHWAVEVWASAFDCVVEEHQPNISLTSVDTSKKNRKALPIRKPLRDPFRIKGHRKELRMLKYSPDGKWLASASYDRTIRIWDPKGQQKAILYGGHRERVRVIAYRPDGQQLVSGGDDCAARIWDMRTGKKGLRLLGHSAPIIDLQFTPSGKHLVSLGLDRKISVWRVESAEMEVEIGPFEEQPSGVCLDPLGNWMAVSFPNRVDLLNIETKERTASFQTKGSTPQVLASKRGLIIGDERGLRIVDPRSGTHQIQFKGHYKGITALALDPQEVSLVSAGQDQTLRVWEFENATLCWTFELRKQAQTIDVNFQGTIAVTFGEPYGFLFPMGRGV